MNKPPIVWKSEQERKEYFAMVTGKPNPIWQFILRLIDWLNYFGFRTRKDIILGNSLWFPFIYQVLYGVNFWLYSYSLFVLIILSSNIIYRSRHENDYTPKHKDTTEQMATLGELFEGYEEWVDGGRDVLLKDYQLPKAPRPPRPPRPHQKPGNTSTARR